MGRQAKNVSHGAAGFLLLVTSVLALFCPLRASAAIVFRDSALPSNRFRNLHSASNLIDPNADFEVDDWPEPNSSDITLALQVQQQGEGRASFSPILQPVVFHVIYQSDGTGLIPYASLEKQITELNNDFSGSDAKSAGYGGATDSGLRFYLHGVNYVQNDTEHQMCPLFNWQPIIKRRYAYDPAIYYNVYICQCEAALGLSWIPYQQYNDQQISESHWMLGSIIDNELLPGSTVLGGRWNKGKILTHETGHHYGLMYDACCSFCTCC